MKKIIMICMLAVLMPVFISCGYDSNAAPGNVLQGAAQVQNDSNGRGEADSGSIGGDAEDTGKAEAGE